MNKEQFKNLLSKQVLILDGAMGTQLQKLGYLSNAIAPEELNIKFPERIAELHRSYLEAGSNAIITNTFGANEKKLSDYNLQNKLEEINIAGVQIARKEAEKFNALVFADMGPVGSYLEPLGPLTFDQTYAIFARQAKALAKAEPDAIIIETMTETRELKAALLAAKDNFNGPVIVQMTFTTEGTTVTGTDTTVFVALMEAMGADAIGMNCSVGPVQMAVLAQKILSITKLPLSFKPNAGMPKLINRQTVFPGTTDEFVSACVNAYENGAAMLGGCCGTTPEFINALARTLKGKKPVVRSVPENFFLASRTKAINLKENSFAIIGERINPTNRKQFQEELSAGNFTTLRKEARNQENAGAQLLDINMGIPGADEKVLMHKAVREIQETVQVPLCLDSSSVDALEAGLKMCAGKPLINSINGETKKAEKIFALAKRYGAAIIALASNEKGLPCDKTERLSIAYSIIAQAEKSGFKTSEIVFDFLMLSASAAPEQVKQTLTTIMDFKKTHPENKTVLGLSNVSFGLPNRQAINSTCLSLAKEAGLTMAILNPHENWSVFDDEAKALLLGQDAGAKKYIAKHGSFKRAPVQENIKLSPEAALYGAIIDGSKETAAALAKTAIDSGLSPLEVANEIVLKALNEVGDKFETKEFFLPQVIMSAEAAQMAFGYIKPLLKKEKGFGFGKIILATVYGDVHDIGKNIVGAVLESHGWQVIDLGKNVSCENIISAAKKEKPAVVGLSSLMTTTMLEMEKIIKERNSLGLAFKIMIGGAPVTKKFAIEIGADGFAKDAVEAAKVAKGLAEKN